MSPSATNALDSFRAIPAEDRRELFADMIRDFVARDGREQTLQFLLASVFGPRTPLMERQAETLAAFARLPKDSAASLLLPFDPSSLRTEDCLSDADIDRLLTCSNG